MIIMICVKIWMIELMLNCHLALSEDINLGCVGGSVGKIGEILSWDRITLNTDHHLLKIKQGITKWSKEF